MTQLQKAIRDKITKYSDACGMCTDTTRECDTCEVEGILKDLNELQKLANGRQPPRSSQPKPKRIDEDFGTICVCAVRYCFGRQTYMPSLVQDFVRRNFKYLNDNELQVMVDDINFAERINQLGDERIDKPDWLKFRASVKSELENRKAEKNA